MIYVMVTTVLTYAVKYVLPERMRAATHDLLGPTKADLRAELGRAPTLEEVVAEYLKRHDATLDDPPTGAPPRP